MIKSYLRRKFLIFKIWSKDIMKSINKIKNDSISEQASATKEEMIEFASKYKNIEAFKDSGDETTCWFIMLFILLMYIDYNTQKL